VKGRQVLVEAFCPDEGKTYLCRWACQIHIVLAEKRGDGNEADEAMS